MVLLPQRLFQDPNARVLWQDGERCMLHKILPDPLYDREGYISRHAVSLVLSGEQRIRTFDEEMIRVRAGQLAIISRGLYVVSDLLLGDKPFESILFYFDAATIRQFLAKATVTEAHPQQSSGLSAKRGANTTTIRAILQIN